MVYFIYFNNNNNELYDFLLDQVMEVPVGSANKRVEERSGRCAAILAQSMI